jgi:hypothetical protein
MMGRRDTLFNMVESNSLRSYFTATQERFAEAETFEEKRELLAISREIIREALDQIAEQRAQVAAQVSFAIQSHSAHPHSPANRKSHVST